MSMEALSPLQKKNKQNQPKPKKARKKTQPKLTNKQKNQVGKYAVVPEFQCCILDVLYLPGPSKDKSHQYLMKNLTPDAVTDRLQVKEQSMQAY